MREVRDVDDRFSDVLRVEGSLLVARSVGLQCAL